MQRYSGTWNAYWAHFRGSGTRQSIRQKDSHSAKEGVFWGPRQQQLLRHWRSSLLPFCCSTACKTCTCRSITPGHQLRCHITTVRAHQLFLVPRASCQIIHPHPHHPSPTSTTSTIQIGLLHPVSSPVHLLIQPSLISISSVVT